MTQEEILTFYKKAMDFVLSTKYKKEFEDVDKRHFKDATAQKFLSQFAYVVLNTGMKNQVAEKMFQRLCKEGISSIKYTKKREAIDWVQNNYEKLFKELQEQKNDVERIAYLRSLPFIGDITKFHLARNLGIDCAKPDRHLKRLAEKYGFQDTHDMVDFIHEKTGERKGTIDVIVWRYLQIMGTNKENNWWR